MTDADNDDEFTSDVLVARNRKTHRSRRRKIKSIIILLMQVILKLQESKGYVEADRDDKVIE